MIAILRRPTLLQCLEGDQQRLRTLRETNPHQVLLRLLDLAVGYVREPLAHVKMPALRWLKTVYQSGDDGSDDQTDGGAS